MKTKLIVVGLLALAFSACATTTTQTSRQITHPDPADPCDKESSRQSMDCPALPSVQLGGGTVSMTVYEESRTIDGVTTTHRKVITQQHGGPSNVLLMSHGDDKHAVLLRALGLADRLVSDNNKVSAEVSALFNELVRIQKAEATGANMAPSRTTLGQSIVQLMKPRFETLRKIFLERVEKNGIVADTEDRIASEKSWFLGTLSSKRTWGDDELSSKRTWGDDELSSKRTWKDDEFSSKQSWGQNEASSTRSWTANEISSARQWGKKVPNGLEDTWTKTVDKILADFITRINTAAQAAEASFSNSEKVFQGSLLEAEAAFEQAADTEEKYFLSHLKDG